MSTESRSILFGTNICTALASCSAPSRGIGASFETAASVRTTYGVKTKLLQNKTKPDLESELGKRLERIYGGKYGDWLRSYGLRPSWETHYDAIENDLWHGYKPNPSSFIYCIRSAFYPTNETFNFWSHFLPFLFFLLRAYNIFTTIDDPTNPVYFPFWIHLSGLCYMLLASSLAHLFHSVSCQTQETCWCLDYGGITVVGFAMVTINEMYIFPRACYGETSVSSFSYLMVFFCMASVVNVLACVSRFPSCPYYFLFRFVPVAISLTAVSVPAGYRFFSLVTTPTTYTGQSLVCAFGSDGFPVRFTLLVLFFFASFVVNATRFPEKYYPGTFDIIGSSHNLFHVFLVFAMYFYTLMAEEVLFDVRDGFENGILTVEDLSMEPWHSLYLYILYIAVAFMISVKMSGFTAKKVELMRSKKIS